MLIEGCYKNILKELFTISPGLNLHEKKKIVKNKTNFYMIKKHLRTIKNLQEAITKLFSPFSSTFLDSPYAPNFELFHTENL